MTYTFQQGRTVFKLEYASIIVRNFAVALVSITGTVWLALAIIPSL